MELEYCGRIRNYDFARSPAALLLPYPPMVAGTPAMAALRHWLPSSRRWRLWSGLRRRGLKHAVTTALAP